jgi:hypothetical protein
MKPATSRKTALAAALGIGAVLSIAAVADARGPRGQQFPQADQ